MKIGIVSDIHGNMDAFAAVLNDLREKNIEKLICLGDAVGGGPKSEDVIKKIIELGNKIIFVQGNHEGYMLNGMPKFVHDNKRPVSSSEIERVNFELKNLSESSLEFISKQPKESTWVVLGKKIFITHYPRKNSNVFSKFFQKPDANECTEIFNNYDADVYLYGHTHIINFQNNNNKLYINPGALGCPVSTNNAPYGILDIDENSINYTQMYSNYDIESVINNIKKIHAPGYETVLKIFYGCNISI